MKSKGEKVLFSLQANCFLSPLHKNEKNICCPIVRQNNEKQGYRVSMFYYLKLKTSPGWCGSVD